MTMTLTRAGNTSKRRPMMSPIKTVLGFIALIFADLRSGARGEVTTCGIDTRGGMFHHIHEPHINEIGILWLRGGGAGRNRGSLHAQGVPASNFQPPAILARIPSLWQQRLLPLLQESPERIRDSLLHQQPYKKRPETSGSRKRVQNGSRKQSHDTGTRRHTSTNSVAAPSPSPPTASAIESTKSLSLQALLLPSRMIKLSLLAFVLAEILDRVGILYEDNPTILKSQLEALWYYDIEPTLLLWRAHCLEFYGRRIQPYLPSFLRRGSLNGEDLRRHVVSFLSTTKVAFALGASLGMISSPMLVQWTLRYWKPSLAVYTLAEVNHYCKLQGKKLVQRLGETPQTLGATLDGILEQCRNLVRRTVVGKVALDDGSVVSLRGTSMLGGSDATVSLFGGGGGGGNDGTPSDGASSKNVEWRSSLSNDVATPKKLGYTLGLSSPTTSETVTKQDDTLVDFQGLVNEFKEWMVVHPEHRHGPGCYSNINDDGVNGARINPKGEIMKHGFWAGCAIGLASLGM